MQVKKISSIQNTTVKRILQLQSKSRVRIKEDTFVVEGLREVQLAIGAGYEITDFFIEESAFENFTIQRLIKDAAVEITLLTHEVYQKVAYRGSTEGIIAFSKAKKTSLQDLDLPKNPLLLIAEAPEKPGNIGALLRTADAAGADAFIIANPKTDLYNPNIIRSSVGCVFTNQVAAAPSDAIITFLQKKGINIYSAILQEAQSYDTQDYTAATAIVVGTEAIGLSESWRTASTQNVIIPMQGAIDSMNVSVAAGILIFEARRQRRFSKQ